MPCGLSGSVWGSSLTKNGISMYTYIVIEEFLLRILVLLPINHHLYVTAKIIFRIVPVLLPVKGHMYATPNKKKFLKRYSIPRKPANMMCGMLFNLFP